MRTLSLPGRILRFAAACALAVTLAGCEDHHHHHKPPAGQGSLIVENNTGGDIRVYLDSKLVGTAKESRDTTFDTAPGYYRLVLDERGGDRYAALDLDIVEGRLTVAEVDLDNSIYRYDVYLRME